MILNKTEKIYIDRLFELKPNCTGKELLSLMQWMATKNMPGWDDNYGHIRDDVILGKNGYGIKYAE